MSKDDNIYRLYYNRCVLATTDVYLNASAGRDWKLFVVSSAGPQPRYQMIFTYEIVLYFDFY